MPIWRSRARRPRASNSTGSGWCPPKGRRTKQGVTHAPYADRYGWSNWPAAANPKLEASRLEQGTTSSYSIDTIEKVRARLAPGDTLFFVIGADAFAEIESWHRWQDVIRAVEFIVVSRPGHRYDIPAAATVHRLETVDLPVSSSEIRRQLAAGDDSVEVPAAVLDYIRARGLYRG